MVEFVLVVGSKMLVGVFVFFVVGNFCFFGVKILFIFSVWV